MSGLSQGLKDMVETIRSARISVATLSTDPTIARKVFRL
jgi:hypothetical protein